MSYLIDIKLKIITYIDHQCFFWFQPIWFQPIWFRFILSRDITFGFGYEIKEKYSFRGCPFIPQSKNAALPTGDPEAENLFTFFATKSKKQITNQKLIFLIRIYNLWVVIDLSLSKVVTIYFHINNQIDTYCLGIIKQIYCLIQKLITNSWPKHLFTSLTCQRGSLNDDCCARQPGHQTHNRHVPKSRNLGGHLGRRRAGATSGAF